jgi:flagellar basal body rod protein FlgG
MLGTLSVSHTGLNASRYAIDNIGNNQANENTPGYKKRVVDLSEIGQVAIKNLIEYTDVVRQVAKTEYTDDQLYKIIGPAAYFVTPAEDRRNIDVAKLLSTTSSQTFMKDLRALISYQVREMAIKLAKDSVIGDALKVIAVALTDTL